MADRMRTGSFVLACSMMGWSLAAAAAEPSTGAAVEAGERAVVLDGVTLDRVTAGASAAAALVVGDAPGPQVVVEPPRRLRDLAPWLRRQIGCALPGRVCIQG